MTTDQLQPGTKNRKRLPASKSCWLIWERFVTLTANKRYLRSIDTTKVMKDVHVDMLKQEKGHGTIEVEEVLTNHLMGHSLALVMGNATRLRDGD